MNLNQTSTNLELSKQGRRASERVVEKIVSKWSDRHSWRRVAHAE